MRLLLLFRDAIIIELIIHQDKKKAQLVVLISSKSETVIKI